LGAAINIPFNKEEKIRLEDKPAAIKNIERIDSKLK